MMTNYLRNKIQDFLFLKVAFTPPNTYYIALSKTQPLADGTGVTEPIGGGYARISINADASSFTSSIDGIVKNKVSLLSPESTAVWGNIPYYGVYDSLTGGNLLYGGSFANVRNIDIEMQLVIEANGVSFGLS